MPEFFFPLLLNFMYVFIASIFKGLFSRAEIFQLINGTLIIFTFIAVMRALGDIFVALVIVFTNNILKISLLS